MDTYDLSAESYKGIITESEKFSRDLTLQFGVLASSCKNESEYLLQARSLVKEIRSLNNDELSDLFFGATINKADLKKALDKIVENISEVENIPESKRHYDF